MAFDELNKILKTIEELRLKLQELVDTKDFTDPEVLAASRMLDALLNEYHKLLKNRCTP